MKTMLVGKASSWEKNIGRGVKNRLEANEKSTNAIPKTKKLSFLNFSRTDSPSISREAAPTPRQVESIFFSMLTNRRSKIKSGSVTRKIERTKATKFKPLQRSKV